MKIVHQMWMNDRFIITISIKTISAVCGLANVKYILLCLILFFACGNTPCDLYLGQSRECGQSLSSIRFQCQNALPVKLFQKARLFHNNEVVDEMV